MKEFFDDAEIFITGGSGVVGKALIEKLLRSCDVRRIYLLLRPKKNCTVQQRLEVFKKEKIFSRVLREKPNCFDVVEAIAGDVLYPKLGISAEDLSKLKNVTFFYHSAATVRFNEPLKLALTLNVGGTHEALLVAEKLENLKLFMYVSTFFSNPYLTHVEEKIYPTPMPWRFALERLREDLDEDVLEILSKKITVGFPNTYTFTKNLCESLVNDFRDRVPVVVYRPSVVVQAMSEPEPGFPPSLMGVVGLFALVSAGLLKGVYCDLNNRLDLTPLDICAKTMLYFTIRGWRDYNKNGIPKEVPVYIVSTDKYVKWSFIESICLSMEKNLWVKNAFEKNILIPGLRMTESKLIYMTTVFCQQIPAAILGDLLLRLFNHPPLIMNIIRKGFLTMNVMEPFRTNNYTANGITHYEEMQKETENTILSFDNLFEEIMSEENMVRIIDCMIRGVRTHLLDENPDTIERSRKIIEMKIFIYNFIRGVLLYFVIVWLKGKLFD